MKEFHLRFMIKGWLRSWQEHTSMQMATLIVLTATFTVLSGFLFVHSHLQSLLQLWGQNVQITIFLKDEIQTTQLSKLEKFLSDSQAFTNIHYISKNEAAQSFVQRMGHYSTQLLEDPEFGNPLPASLEAHIVDNTQINGLVKQIAQLPGIEDIFYGQGWIENYKAAVDLFSKVGYALALVLLAGSLLVIGNIVRHSIHQRRDEIEVLELMGATSFMIRLPFLCEGAFLGLLSSMASLGVLGLLFYGQQKMFPMMLNFWGLNSQFHFLSPSEILGILAVGLWFGFLGSFLCVRRLTHGWTAAEGPL